MLPDTTLIRRESGIPQSQESNTGTAFFAGLAERGSVTAPELITSLSQAKVKYGPRSSSLPLIDSLETFFEEGGSQAYVIRYDGPDLATASGDLLDGSAGVALTVRAKSPGAWGNSLRRAVLAGDPAGHFKIQITTVPGSALEAEQGSVLETSPDLADTAAAVSWGDTATWVAVEQGASTTDPAVLAATALTGGVDDRADASTTEQAAALALLPEDLGPGQVAIPGATSAAVHAVIAAHAAATNRVALLDMPDTATVATITGVAATNRALGNAYARFLGQFAPWGVIPGVLPGTTRTVPLSAAVAGVIARLDGLFGNPNLAAMGEQAPFRFVSGFSQAAWTDTQREVLADAGVNVGRVHRNRAELSDFVTATSQVTDPGWVALSNSRLNVAIAADAVEIGDDYRGRQLDQITIAEFGGRLAGMMLGYHQLGALDGATAQQAYSVDVGSQVNTPESLAANKLRGVIEYEDNGFARRVELELTKGV